MSATVVRAPLRVSLGGGGTDLPSYYLRYRGFVVSGTIDKYVYMLALPSSSGTWQLKYSRYEEHQAKESVEHPIFREALKLYQGPPLEINVAADVSAGTGLGSSGAFTVCLLKSLALQEGRGTTSVGLAEQACQIEIEDLGYAVGKQDQYASACGGICGYTFTRDEVMIDPLLLSPETRESLRANLLAFYTGQTRYARDVLADQRQKTEAGDDDMVTNLHLARKLGFAARDALQAGDMRSFALLMHEHWVNKHARSATISNSRIDYLYARARSSGAIGGKLLGAGGGGYLLVYTEHPDMTREAMRDAGARELRFDFQPQGCHAVL